MIDSAEIRFRASAKPYQVVINVSSDERLDHGITQRRAVTVFEWMRMRHQCAHTPTILSDRTRGTRPLWGSETLSLQVMQRFHIR